MIRIEIISDEKLFSDMLCSEISALGREFCVYNEKDSDSNLSYIPDFQVFDLDRGFKDNDFISTNIIGYSRNEGLLSKYVEDKCKIILHRPFLIDEFLHHVENMSKVILNVGDADESEIQKMRISPKDMSVFFEGRKINLSKNEFSILKKLFENRSNPVKRESLCECLSSDKGNICDVYVCHLRNKLERETGKKVIYTVRNKGYMLKI